MYKSQRQRKYPQLTFKSQKERKQLKPKTTASQTENLLNIDDSILENFEFPNVAENDDNQSLMNLTGILTEIERKDEEFKRPELPAPKKRKSENLHESKFGSNIIVLDTTQPELDSENFNIDIRQDVELMEYLKSQKKNPVCSQEVLKPSSPQQHVVPNPETLEPDSDIFGTQCLRELDFAVWEATSDKKKKPTTVEDEIGVRPSQLCAMFDSDMDIDDFKPSQRFLDDVKRCSPLPATQKSPISKLLAREKLTFNSTLTGSQYIRRQRTMYEQNCENIDDDDFVMDFSTQDFHMSQYRLEVQADFEEAERSIFGITDPNLAGISSINWDSPIPVPKTQKFGTASTVIREKLNTIMPRKLLASPVTPPVLKPVSSSKFCDKGPFFGLPAVVSSLIKEFKGIESLYDWQKECLRLPSIVHRTNLIYALPTSGGKTLVAEIIILREVICRQKNVIFILPFISIVQEKVWALSPFAVALNFLVEEYAAGKGKCPPIKRRSKNSVFVCTIEKSLSLIDSLIEDGRLHEVGLVVVDEMHLLGEKGRGSVLENGLTKIMFLKAANIQIVGMSATIGNLEEVKEFLNADIYVRDFRPVELQEYIKCENEILRINPHGSEEEMFEKHRTVDFQYSKAMSQIDKDQLGGLVMEVVPDNSVLIFCATKKNCVNVAEMLAKIFNNKYLNHRAAEKRELMSAIRRDTSSPLCTVLELTIPHGIAYHHSGLTMDERKHLEDAYRLGIINVICCTSTLAAGVNLPAQRVIVRSPYVGNSFITLSKYKQMIGRAGRAGLGKAGESFLIAQPRDNLRIANLLRSPMDIALSSMLVNDRRGIQSLILSSISLGIATCRRDITRLMSSTLLGVQSQHFDVDLMGLVDETIKYLFRKKALEKRSCQQNLPPKADDVEFITSQEAENQKTTTKIGITNSMPLEITRIGKASVRACLDMDRAIKLFEELVDAQNSLYLNDFLHLLYILVPQDRIDDIYPTMDIYATLLARLSNKNQATAKILKITESIAVKLGKTTTFPVGMESTLKRFFVALMLQDLWENQSVYSVSRKFKIDRGIVQNMMGLVGSNATCIIRFCEHMDNFWAIYELLKSLSTRLSHFCRNELLPLMELPSVKVGRARQLYAAGFRNLQSIARATNQEMVDKVEHLNHRVAKQLIAAARLLLLERVETLREEAALMIEEIK